MATSKISVTEGSGKYLATYSLSEDTLTKEIQRATLNTSAGVEAGTTTAPIIVSGTIANNAPDSGNSVKIGGVYNATPPTLDTGDRGDVQLDQFGNIKVSLATKGAGEDLLADVMKVEQRYNYAAISAATTTLIKGQAGQFHTMTVTGGTTGAITIYDNTTATGTIIASFDSTNILETYTFDVQFATGLTVVTAAGTKLTITYR